MATKYINLDSKTKSKKTVFTKAVSKDLTGIVDTSAKPEDFENVLHIGYDSKYGDVFKCWNIHEHIFLIFFGTKGDEFNS